MFSIPSVPGATLICTLTHSLVKNIFQSEEEFAMRYPSILVATALVLSLGAATLAASGDRSPSKDDKPLHYYLYHHYHQPPPPPPPPSKRCPCDSKGNPIDNNCGKGNDSNLP